MIDRLIELLSQADFDYDEECNICVEDGYTIPLLEEFFADYLLKNGVIVSPCKVGDTVYVVGEITRQIIPYEITAIVYAKEGLFMTCNILCFSVEHQFNKTVFLTKEEAEKHLQKGTN